MQRRTYTFHLQWSEDPAGHEDPQWDGENQEERQCQREGALLDHPEDAQTQKLD